MKTHHLNNVPIKNNNKNTDYMMIFFNINKSKLIERKKKSRENLSDYCLLWQKIKRVIKHEISSFVVFVKVTEKKNHTKIERI